MRTYLETINNFLTKPYNRAPYLRIIVAKYGGWFSICEEV